MLKNLWNFLKQTKELPEDLNASGELSPPQRIFKRDGSSYSKKFGKTTSREIGTPVRTRRSTRKSSLLGWQRGFRKYSPSKETALSPLKMTEANIINVNPEIDDHFFDIGGWVLSMSEQHFYDNAFLLLNFSKTDPRRMAAVLHRSFVGVDVSFFSSLKDVTVLGGGSFGKVFSCRDPLTNMTYAIKQLPLVNPRFKGHMKHILGYMVERNTVIRAMSSPFVIRLYYSLQMKSGDLLLFFEYCIGDLDKFISVSSKYDQVSKNLFENTNELMQILNKDQPEMLEVSFIYVFEILSALDFLASCNIVHQDIKPQNIMVSDVLHLKIGDFGLAYRTRTIHKRTNVLLVRSKLVEKSDKQNYTLSTCGTLTYEDFELQLMQMKKKDKNIFDDVFEDRDIFDAPGISFEDSVLEPTFLTDTWAAGIIFVMLLFRGFNIFSPNQADKDIFEIAPLNDFSFFVIYLVGNQYIYTNYIHSGLVEGGGSYHQDLMEFIASIFRPRKTRCEEYVKEKDVYRYTKLAKKKYVDIEKVEKFNTFYDREFTRSNIHMRPIPEKIRHLYVKKAGTKYKNFMDAFGSNTGSPKSFDFGLGSTINFFN